VTAPAKINLTLEILARRSDGYHALRSVMVPIALADEVTVAPAPRFAFRCEPASLEEDNLVVRALGTIGLTAAPLAVALRKRIPVGAGLGGGSSDAATVLRAAMHGALGDVAPVDWLAAARELGSDVPFFLVDAPAIVEGTGERVTALGRAPAWWAVVVVPPVPVATGRAYALLDAARERTPMPSRPRASSATLRCAEALQRADLDAVTATMTNDFEHVIAEEYPAVGDALAALRGAGTARPMLSGSGSACFALSADEGGARALAARVVLREAAVHVVPFAQSGAWR